MNEHIYTCQKNRVFVKYGHECELIYTEEDNRKLNFCQRFRRYFNEIRMVSQVHHLSNALLRSQGAIMREKKRHLLYFPYTIHPFSDLRKWWETLIVFVLFLEFIVIPVDVGYYADVKYHALFYNYWWIIFRNILDFMLVLDIVMNFLTGYYDYVEKEVVLDLSHISRYYLKTLFVPHLFSSLPTHIDLMFRSTFKFEEMQTHLVRLELQLLSLLKAMRVHTFWTYLPHCFLVHNVSYTKQLVIFTVISMVFFTHTVTCLLLFLTERAQLAVLGFSNLTVKPRLNQEEYDDLIFLDQIPPAHTYVFNMYYASQIIWHSAVPNALVQDWFSYVLVGIMYLASRVLFVYCLSRITEIVRAYSSSTNKYDCMVRQLREYMTHKQLPEYMQRRLLAYHEFRFQKSYFRESEILNALTGQLRQEVIMHSCRKLVENVEFFKNIPLALIIRIVSCLKSQIFLINDVIIRANTLGDSMYFISSGTVMILTLSGNEICHLEDGDHFGEIALIMENEVRIASVVAVEACELYKLERNDFIRAIQPYPDLLYNIKRTATNRLENTTFLDEVSRRQLSSRNLYC